MRQLFRSFCVAALLHGCGKEGGKDVIEIACEEPEIVEVKEFGFTLNDYLVKRDTIRRGDSFGEILERNHLEYPKIYQIAQKAKDTFNIRKLQIGKPYTLLCSKDTLEQAKCFIYKNSPVEYVIINFEDSIAAYKERVPIEVVEKQGVGVIEGSLYETLIGQGMRPELAFEMADIYAWTVDFFRLYPGDRFKVIYTEKFIEDTVSIGIGRVKAAYFEHQGEPFYAFEYKADSILGINDYFDDNAKNLRRAFLKAPVKFSRISSRYNLRRRIAYYGRVKPHKGTDFAAPVGTPIMSTANGVVTKSGYDRGNGNYVKVKHNSIYSTQYLHMKKRKVKVGQRVKQGDVIGWVGMTGFTAGPHVCYRFWKNGRQVDPFRQKLPEAEPVSPEIKQDFLKHIIPIKQQLDNLRFPAEEATKELVANANQP